MNFIRLAFLYLIYDISTNFFAADGGGGSIGNSTSGGLFVSKEKGSDSGDGTMEKPYRLFLMHYLKLKMELLFMLQVVIILVKMMKIFH